MSAAALRQVIAPLRAALYDLNGENARRAIGEVFAPDAPVHLAHPFETLASPDALWTDALGLLARAMPDLERRDTMVLAGHSLTGEDWAGCLGYYTGTFLAPFLDIPPTGHQAAMRFHEFYKIEGGKVVEFQALWDIPELMMQAGAWPMVPSLGREWQVPGPATQDGLAAHDATRSAGALQLVSDMLAGLGNFATGGVKAMRLQDYWHPKMNWYGPAGIGTNRGIAGFHHWHQIPFLNAMPDRVGTLGKGNLFAEGDYVGFTAWPGMKMTVSGDGWLGIAPSNTAITMRSLDFWRCEGDLIRENWVLVDLLHVYAQLGVNVLGRMREFNKVRHVAPIALADGGYL